MGHRASARAVSTRLLSRLTCRCELSSLEKVTQNLHTRDGARSRTVLLLLFWWEKLVSRPGIEPGTFRMDSYTFEINLYRRKYTNIFQAGIL